MIETVEALLTLLDKPISELKLPLYRTRILNALNGYGYGQNIETLGQLAVMTPQELLKRRNFGKACLNELRDALNGLGLDLGMELPRFVHSGWCCRQGPCAFGEWDKKHQQCIHLTKDDHCAIYHEIIARPVEEWYWNPAFGAGCCATLNPRRSAMLKRNPDLLERHLLRPPVGNAERGHHVSSDGEGAGRRGGSGSRPSGVRASDESRPQPLGSQALP